MNPELNLPPAVAAKVPADLHQQIEDLATNLGALHLVLPPEGTTEIDKETNDLVLQGLFSVAGAAQRLLRAAGYDFDDAPAEDVKIIAMPPMLTTGTGAVKVAEVAPREVSVEEAANMMATAGLPKPLPPANLPPPASREEIEQAVIAIIEDVLKLHLDGRRLDPTMNVFDVSPGNVDSLDVMDIGQRVSRRFSREGEREVTLPEKAMSAREMVDHLEKVLLLGEGSAPAPEVSDAKPPKPWTRESIHEAVLAIVADKLNIQDPASIPLAETFANQGADSLDHVEIQLGVLECFYGGKDRDLPEDALLTTRAVIDYLVADLVKEG